MLTDFAAEAEAVMGTCLDCLLEFKEVAHACGYSDCG